MLAQILPEVHSIFSDEAVETDLTSIKKIKKTCADTKHIVANREMEIKDIVRGICRSHLPHPGRILHTCILSRIRMSASKRKKHTSPTQADEEGPLQDRLQLQLLLELPQDTRCSALILMQKPRAHLSL